MKDLNRDAYLMRRSRCTDAEIADALKVDIRNVSGMIRSHQEKINRKQKDRGKKRDRKMFGRK